MLTTLLANPAIWMQRRVEQIEFVDDSCVRRRVSLSFDLSRIVEGNAAGASPILVLPFALLEKWPLTSFSVRDGGGSSRQLLHHDDNREYVEALLERAFLGLDPAGEMAHTKPAIARLVSGQGEDPFEMWRQVGPALSAWAGHDQGRLFLVHLVREFVRSFLALVPISATEIRGVIKYEYVKPLKWEARLLGHRFAWRPTHFNLPLPAAGFGRTYHVEVVAPSGLELSKMRVERTNWSRDADGDHVERPETPLTEVTGRKSRIHLHASRLEPFANHRLHLHLVPQRRGALRVAFVGSLFILATLAVVLLKTESVWSAQVDAFAAMMLATPAIALTLVNRDGEHALAERLLLGVRTLLGALCGLAFVFAGAIVLRMRFPVFEWPALVGLILGGIMTLMLTHSYHSYPARPDTQRFRNGDRIALPDALVD